MCYATINTPVYLEFDEEPYDILEDVAAASDDETYDEIVDPVKDEATTGRKLVEFKELFH